MSQAERISRIHFLLKAKGFVTMQELKSTFEVSRATVMRDIELMRDRLGAKLTYDAKERGYRYQEHPVRDRRQEYLELPGLWLSPKEGYAFLTMFNILGAVDPGFLLQFADPMRKVLKRLLIAQEFEMSSLDQKVVIDLPGFHKPERELLTVFSGLLTGNAVQLTWKDAEAKVHETVCRISQMRMTESGWNLVSEPLSGGVRTIVPLTEVVECQALAPHLHT